jgi:hypothetical protein
MPGAVKVPGAACRWWACGVRSVSPRCGSAAVRLRRRRGGPVDRAALCHAARDRMGAWGGGRSWQGSGAGGAEREDGGQGFVAGWADLVGWEDEADAVFGAELDGEGEGVEVAVEPVGHGA